MITTNVHKEIHHAILIVQIMCDLILVYTVYSYILDIVTVTGEWAFRDEIKYGKKGATFVLELS